MLQGSPRGPSGAGHEDEDEDDDDDDDGGKHRHCRHVYVPFVGKLGPLARRVRRLWEAFEGWFGEHLPEAAPTIAEQPPVTAAAWKAFETAIINDIIFQVPMEVGEEVPQLAGLAVLRILYDVHDGQAITNAATAGSNTGETNDEVFMGMLGGYSAYHHAVSCRLMSLDDVLFWARRLA